MSETIPPHYDSPEHLPAWVKMDPDRPWVLKFESPKTPSELSNFFEGKERKAGRHLWREMQLFTLQDGMELWIISSQPNNENPNELIVYLSFHNPKRNTYAQVFGTYDKEKNTIKMSDGTSIATMYGMGGTSNSIITPDNLK